MVERPIRHALEIRHDSFRVPEFVELVRDSGANIYGCKMSMDMMKLTKEDLVDGAEVLGAMEFIEKAAGAQTLFV